jgi:CHASE1-domain containing sensor protein
MRALHSRVWLAAALLLILTGLVLGAATYRNLTGYQTQRIRVRFDRSVNRAAVALEQRVSTILEALYFLQALFDASEKVTREEFANCTRGTLSRHPSIQAMEWVPRVPAGERESHETDARRRGFEGYEITEQTGPGRMERASPRTVYFPAFYVEPLAGNECALGFDLASDPTRRAALSRALETDRAAFAGP